jgi:hypothetical protein
MAEMENIARYGMEKRSPYFNIYPKGINGSITKYPAMTNTGNKRIPNKKPVRIFLARIKMVNRITASGMAPAQKRITRISRVFIDILFQTIRLNYQCRMRWRGLLLPTVEHHESRGRRLNDFTNNLLHHFILDGYLDRQSQRAISGKGKPTASDIRTRPCRRSLNRYYLHLSGAAYRAGPWVGKSMGCRYRSRDYQVAGNRSG